MPAIDLNNFYTAQVAFDSSGKSYTYKANMPLAERDSVIVAVGASGKLSVGIVTAIGGKDMLDPQAKFTYKWIVQKIDRAPYDAILDAEAAARNPAASNLYAATLGEEEASH